MRKVDKTKSTVNKYKLIYLPMFIGILAIITVSITSYYISKNLILDQMKQDGINLAKLTARKINTEIIAVKVINNLVDDKIKTAGKVVINEHRSLNNETLKDIARDTGVDEINWYSPKGEIIFSTIEDYIGWISTEEHPVESFRVSEKDEYLEEIRKDTGSEFYYKYGYLRNEDGSFVQVGIRANRIEELLKELNYQHIVETLAQEENIAYALIVDPQLKAIADSDVDDIGVDYIEDEEYQKAIKGETRVFYWYYDKINNDVLEVAVPIIANQRIIGILGIGLYLENVQTSILFIFTTFTIITIGMVILFLWVQNRNIIKPITDLDRNIRQIDVEKNLGYRIPLSKSDTFLGLSVSVNMILERIDNYFNLLKEKEEYIKFIANHDPLTNLPNRRMFLEKLEQELKKEKAGAVMLIDLDNFKEINDSEGHLYGDEVLKKFAENLRGLCEENIFISRFGGDEFLVLMQEEDLEKIEVYASKVVKLFANRTEGKEAENSLSCSVGITLYPSDSIKVNQLLMNADKAMYSAKKLGKNTYYFFQSK